MEWQKSQELNEATHGSRKEAQKGQQDASQLRTQMERELEALILELSLEHAEQRRAMRLLFKSQSEQLNRVEVVGDAMKQAENAGPGLLLSMQFVRRSLLETERRRGDVRVCVYGCSARLGIASVASGSRETGGSVCSSVNRLFTQPMNCLSVSQSVRQLVTCSALV